MLGEREGIWEFFWGGREVEMFIREVNRRDVCEVIIERIKVKWFCVRGWEVRYVYVVKFFSFFSYFELMKVEVRSR